MESGMGLDFGGIAKGYTSDRLMAISMNLILNMQ